MQSLFGRNRSTAKEAITAKDGSRISIELEDRLIFLYPNATSASESILRGVVVLLLATPRRVQTASITVVDRYAASAPGSELQAVVVSKLTEYCVVKAETGDWGRHSKLLVTSETEYSAGRHTYVWVLIAPAQSLTLYQAAIRGGNLAFRAA